MILGVTDTTASFPSPLLVFLPHFLFSSYIPLIWSYAYPSDHIKSLYLPWQLCHVSSFHLFMLLMFHLLCSHDSSSSQLELIFVSSILNTQTYKTPFSHTCLSSYSYLPFNCEHHEGSDKLVKWSFSTIDLLSPLPRFLVCLLRQMQEWEHIIFTVCNTRTQLHFTFKILSFFWFMLLCSQWFFS